MKASIITIGDELLNGQTIDTNSAWIAQQLNTIGIDIQRRVSVGDVADDIWNALDGECQKVDLVLMTGGLGPTSDDITKPLLCRYFGGQMILHEPSLNIIKDIFIQAQRPLLQRNINQAMVPDTCEVILNKSGTAPAMMFRKQGTLFISMPGVPFEMKNIMRDVLPLLQQQFQLPHIHHEYILLYGIGESFVAEKLQDFEQQIPPFIKLAYLPNAGFIKLRFTGKHDNKDVLISTLLQQKQQCIDLLREYIVSTSYQDVVDALRQELLAQNATIAFAESCTGGMISHLMTQHDGASNYFLGSVVSYSNQVKHDVLNVSLHDINTYDPVSQQVALSMCQGVLRHLQPTYAVAITGYLSTTEKTPHLALGQVYIAVGNATHQDVFNIKLKGNNRAKNIETAALIACEYARQWITKQSQNNG